jgi:hypothetical protein
MLKRKNRPPRGPVPETRQPQKLVCGDGHRGKNKLPLRLGKNSGGKVEKLLILIVVLAVLFVPMAGGAVVGDATANVRIRETEVANSTTWLSVVDGGVWTEAEAWKAVAEHGPSGVVDIEKAIADHPIKTSGGVIGEGDAYWRLTLNNGSGVAVSATGWNQESPDN